jgi:hypothetical protein
MSTPYQQDRFPSAPVLPVRLGIPREAAHDTVFSALIDTGADFTLVPLTWLVQIDAPESRYAYVRGLWSEQRQVTLYLVDLHLETGVLPGVEVAGIDDEDDQEIVLGRNVLNQLILLLDGPHLATDVLERRPQR